MSEKNFEENNFKKEIIDFLKDLVIIVAIVLFTTHAFVSIFIINGQSMYDSYYDKEIILVDRYSLNTFGWIKKQNIRRWDVVVLEPEVDKDKKYYIKRVVWMPWEELKIEKGNVFIKKKWEKKFIKLDEKYLNKENYGHTLVYWKISITYKIPKWKYFVMWDNRNHSTDSRACFSYNCNITDRDNFISSDKIIGKVLVDLWYFNYRNLTFTHPKIKKDWKYIDTTPKWTTSADSYNY